jgi:hypothetical protein
MKAKERIPEQCEQPKTLAAQLHDKKESLFAPWEKQVFAVAEAYLSISDEMDVVGDMHRRAIALCRIVEDMALGQTGSEPSLEALATVMRVVQEEIYVAKWISQGRQGPLE